GSIAANESATVDVAPTGPRSIARGQSEAEPWVGLNPVRTRIPGAALRFAPGYRSRHRWGKPSRQIDSRTRCLQTSTRSTRVTFAIQHLAELVDFLSIQRDQRAAVQRDVVDPSRRCVGGGVILEMPQGGEDGAERAL